MEILDRLISRTEQLAGWFILLAGWHRHLAAFLAGSISALAMPPFDMVFVLFLTFPVLIWLMDGVASDPSHNLWIRLKSAFKCGFFFGFGYFLCGLWWVGNAFLVEAEDFAWALPIAVLGLPAILGVFWGCATALARLFWNGDARRLFILAACFGLFEYLRGFIATGLPWNLISYAAYPTPLFMQSASIFGIYGMVSIAVFCFSAPGIIVPGNTGIKRGRKIVAFVSISLIATHTGYGFWRLPAQSSPIEENVPIEAGSTCD